MKKKIKQKPIPISDFFKPEEIGPLPDNYQGKILIINPNIFKPEFRQRHLLIWRANGGFGCDPEKIGRAVFATCLGDGEDARWDRQDFVAEYVGDNQRYQS